MYFQCAETLFAFLTLASSPRHNFTLCWSKHSKAIYHLRFVMVAVGARNIGIP
jgi:hypothetical protein